MRPVTMFKSNDGKLWSTAADAEAHDKTINDVAAAVALLHEPVGNRKGYVQQDLSVVLEVKVRLLAIAHRVTGQAVYAPKFPDQVSASGMVGRYLDDGGPRLTPVRDVWWRLAATDDQGREWGQTYYALNGTGPDICLNP